MAVDKRGNPFPGERMHTEVIDSRHRSSWRCVPVADVEGQAVMSADPDFVHQPGELVEIEWWDSERVMLGWASRDDYIVALGDRSIYRTAGYIVGEDELSVMVSHSRSDSGSFSDAMLIPRAAIRSIAQLFRAGA